MSPVRGHRPIERPPISVGLELLVVDINFLIRAPKEGFSRIDLSGDALAGDHCIGRRLGEGYRCC